MYRKQQSEQPTVERCFQLKPQLIAIEFSKSEFKKLRDVKQWIRVNYDKLGYCPDMKNEKMFDQDDKGHYFQISQIYKQPIQEVRVKYQQGVDLLYHFTEFQIKDDKGIVQLKKQVEEL